MKTKGGFRLLVFVILGSLIIGIADVIRCRAASTPTIIYQFTARNASNLDGAHPEALLSSGSRLYGLTFAGGASDDGLLFGIDPNGANFQVLHTFVPPDDNPSQTTPLLLSGDTLYGVNHAGFIYALNVSGSDYHYVHEFANANEGAEPECALTLDGDTLFGTAKSGGSGGTGVIFGVKTNGQDFRVLYSFDPIFDITIQTNISGAAPRAGLALHDNVLYGSTQAGGKVNGTIYRINTDGSDFAVLHYFAAGFVPNPNSDGMATAGKLVYYADKLYGTTRWGGSSGNGVFFSLNTNGFGFKTIYTFPGKPDPTVGDPGPLTLAGQKIYGARPAGGAFGQGFIFEYDVTAATFKTNYSFSALDSQLKNIDGNRPASGPVITNDKLYFTASGAGPSGTGTIGFLQLDIPAPTLDILELDQGLRILIHGELGLTYTLEDTDTLSAPTWLHPQAVTLNQNPQSVDMPEPSVPTFWRARFP